MDITVVLLLICLYVVPGLIRRWFNSDPQADSATTASLPAQPLPPPRTEEYFNTGEYQKKPAKKDMHLHENQAGDSVEQDEYIGAITLGVIWSEILQPPLAYRRRRQ